MLDRTKPFRSLPFLGNPHLQTVVANLFGWTRERVPSTLHLVPLPDGDLVALHETTPPKWTPGQPCVLLVHGLGGCHQSGYMRRMTNELAGHGLRVYRMDLRGCGAGMPHAREFYNAACSADVRECLEWMGTHNPGSSLLLVGFSLGGNIALKLAGEAASKPVRNLVGVVSLAAPIDLLRCSNLLAGLPFYDRFYSYHLVTQVRRRARLRPDLPAVEFPSRLTVRIFDEVYTAPRGGYAGAIDYYQRASSLPFIPEITLPTFLLSARDDPFVAWQPYADLPRRDNLEVHLSEGGGHLGFLGPDGRGGIRWAETRIIDWILRRATCSDGDGNGK
jgi:predicted alpha/beta-fold hydrolase